MEVWRRDRRIVGDMIRRIILHIIGPLVGRPIRPFRRPVIQDPMPTTSASISAMNTSAVSLRRSSACESIRSSPKDQIRGQSRIPVAVAGPSYIAPLQAMQGNSTNEEMYTNGQSRVVLAQDGTKNCHALLLTEDLVAKLGRIMKESQSLEQVEYDLDLVSRKAKVAQSSIDQLHHFIEVSKNQEEIDYLKNDIAEREPQLLEICQRRDYLEDEDQTLKRNLNYVRAQVQDVFERALSDAQLLNFPEPEQAQEAATPMGVETEDRSSSLTSDIVPRSAEEAEREEIRAKLEQSRAELYRAQEAFDTRQQSCDKDRGEYLEAVRAGTCDLPESEYDRLEVDTKRLITRDLIDAEVVHEEVLARARKYDLVGNEFDQESNFVDDYYDDYRDSYDAPAVVPNLYFIDYWMKEVDCHKDQLDGDPETEVDEWDAKTIGVSDSVSVVDQTRNRNRIDRWRQTCGL